MGIDGLWPAFLDALADDHSISLTDLGSEALITKGRAVKVGVNGSRWLHTAQTAAWYSSHDENEKLRPADSLSLDLKLSSILAKLLKLLNAGFQVIVIFDGIQTQAYKRGKVLKRQHGLSLEEGDLRKLASALGMVWRQAVGEAEAELAALAKEGTIDYVVTDDADALLFGAPKILGNFSTTAAASKLVKARAKSHSNVDKDITMRTAADDHAAWIVSLADVETELGYSRLDLVFIALLTGGDYEPGLPECGIDTARSLVDALVSQTFWEAWERGEQAGGDTTLEQMQMWRARTAQLLHTGLPSHKNHNEIKKHPHLATTLLASSFPPPNLVALYSNPIVRNPLPPTRWRGGINTLAVVKLLRSALQWEPMDIEPYIYHHLFRPRVIEALRLAISPPPLFPTPSTSTTTTAPPPPPTPPPPLLSLLKTRESPHRPTEILGVFNSSRYVTDLSSALVESEPDVPQRTVARVGADVGKKVKEMDDLRRFECWVPLAWIERVYPKEVVEWREGGMKGKKKAKKAVGAMKKKGESGKKGAVAGEGGLGKWLVGEGEKTKGGVKRKPFAEGRTNGKVGEEEGRVKKKVKVA